MKAKPVSFENPIAVGAIDLSTIEGNTAQRKSAIDYSAIATILNTPIKDGEVEKPQGYVTQSSRNAVMNMIYNLNRKEKIMVTYTKLKNGQFVLFKSKEAYKEAPKKETKKKAETKKKGNKQ